MTLSAEKSEVVVTHTADGDTRAAYAGLLGDVAHVTYLADVPSGSRRAILADAEVLIAWDLASDLNDGEYELLRSLALMQALTAGIDHFPLAELPDSVLIAGNAGAFAEAVAEHVLAMALAATKRLVPEHENLRQRVFNQHQRTGTLRGGTCAILGFGGIGRATAQLMRCLGMTIRAINRRGVTREPVDFIGTLDDLEAAVRGADVVVIALALNRATHGLIGVRELGWMEPHTILVNVARGPIIDEAALYAHLERHPGFNAALDCWWAEPAAGEAFHTDYPFLELANVIGSPHNSSAVAGSLIHAARIGAENVRRYLTNSAGLRLVADEDRLWSATPTGGT
jgi:phosphoglycerate dehydrogenase-like enzyme